VDEGQKTKAHLSSHPRGLEGRGTCRLQQGQQHRKTEKKKIHPGWFVFYTERNTVYRREQLLSKGQQTGGKLKEIIETKIKM
jgi:hypothetical protein